MSQSRAQAKQPSMLTQQVVRDGLYHLIRGGFSMRQGHLPVPQHAISPHFIGVCVASQPDPAVDTYIISQLRDLGIHQVRLDFTYDDLEGFNARFLEALIGAGYRVALHLVQPFSAAKEMLQSAEQKKWQSFLNRVLDLYGAQVQHIEIGTAINRKRWSGYSTATFLMTWRLAHQAVRARNLVLAGPNIQDFEPFYNVSMLKTLKSTFQLPDIVTNNLFCERVPEPESSDHRIFKYAWTRCLKFNLIKKARIIKAINQHFGVDQCISPVAFWAIFRVKRRWPAAYQKQADYAARYFLLMASSGAIDQANWGALICQREGLISDGLTEAEYPDLERVAHYARVDGVLQNFHRYPSFDAVKTVASMIQGAYYMGAVATHQGLEIHHFVQEDTHIHAAWTINGRVAFLSELYDDHSLASAEIKDRDGRTELQHPDCVTESPIYLVWHGAAPLLKAKHLAPDLIIDAHVAQQRYYRFEEGDWHGLVLASHQMEANLLMQALHPERLQAPQKQAALRHARNAIWTVADPVREGQLLTVKQPIKMYPHKALLDRFKPSKAKRSWNGAMELMRRGIGTAPPIAYFEKSNDDTLKQNFYVCAFVPADCTIAQIFSAFTLGETHYLGVSSEEVYAQFAQFCHTMHSRLIYFRDFSGGNILVNIDMHKKLTFSLIDTARLRTYALTPFPMKYRLADLTRACHKLHWEGRERFMQLYLGMTGRPFTWQYRLPFYLYDFKVKLKRTIGRKGWKKLIRRIQKQS